MNFPQHPYPVNMPLTPKKYSRKATQTADKPTVLTPLSAWRLLNKKTFGSISRATFYRWLSSGRVFSYRVGYHMYVPVPEIENVVKLCHEGKWSRD
jgi:hypothetical protein